MAPGDVHEVPRFVATASLASSAAGMPAGFRTLPVFGPGAEIYAQDERNDGVYRIEFGAVRVHRLLVDGRRQITAFHLAGEVFGFEADLTRHFFAEALCTTRLGVLRTGLRQDVSAAELLPVALRHLGHVQEHLLVLGRQSAIERLAAFLVDMSGRQGGLPAFDLPMSRTDIADYLGLTIETVSRTFSRLRRTGVIGLPGLRRVQVLKGGALRSLAGGELDLSVSRTGAMPTELRILHRMVSASRSVAAAEPHAHNGNPSPPIGAPCGPPSVKTRNSCQIALS